MRKAFVLFAPLLVSACSYLKKEATDTPRELPPITLTMVTGEKVLVNNLSGNTILIFYSPGCDHCQREAQDIRRHLDHFKNYTLYFIAGNAPEEINAFAKAYDLKGYPNVLFARAEVTEVLRIMGPFTTPAMYIYSGEKRLVKKFDGETDVEEIVKFL